MLSVSLNKTFPSFNQKSRIYISTLTRSQNLILNLTLMFKTEGVQVEILPTQQSINYKLQKLTI